MASFDYYSGRGDLGARSQLATLYGQSPVTTQRQSMIGSDDIQSYSIQAARIQAMIDQWENALSETDSQMFPMKAALIKAKLKQLRHSLAYVEAGLGSAGAMAAMQSDAAHWSEMEDRAAQSSGISYGTQMVEPLSPSSSWDYSHTPAATGGVYGQFNVGQYQPTYAGPGEYAAPGAYGSPSWMRQGYLTPYGEVRPIGAQEELGALQQAQLWEQGAMRGVNTIEEYLEREPYIQLYGEELTARSKALAPKTYQRKAQWNRALQR